MRKLILHIGAHKTGTSAIQQYLLRHKQALIDKGWFYCERPGRPTNWGHMFRLQVEANGARISLGPLVMKRMLQLMDSGQTNVIFSAEDLWFMDAANIAAFSEAMAERFCKITVIAYVRRQDLMAISHWLQGGKTVQSALIFGGQDGPLKNVNAGMLRYLDYASVLQAWQAALPQADLVVRVYDRELFPNGNVVADFLTASGLGLEPDGADLDINASLGATTVRFVYKLREAGLIQANIQEAFRRNLIQITQDKFLPARQDAQDFVERFAESNDRLAIFWGRKSLFSADFSRYPQESIMPPLDPEYVSENLMVLLLDVIGQLQYQTAPK